ncbi:MAG: transcription elongation factor GreA [Phycisphaerales bacterium]
MEFITAEEKVMLEGRLAILKANRPVLTQRIAEARAQGDLKENADYHAAREDQAMQEMDIRRLEERLSSASVVSKDAMADGVVFVGATVKLREVDSGDEELYRLVGESSGKVSADIVEVTLSSPMGESLMKARIGEIIKVDAPRKTLRFEVIEIL